MSEPTNPEHRPEQATPPAGDDASSPPPPPPPPTAPVPPPPPPPPPPPSGLPATSPVWVSGPPTSPPLYEPVTTAPPGGGPPGWAQVRIYPQPPGRDVGSGRRALLAVVTVMVVVTGVFGAVNLAAGGRTGAASPEGAAERFFDALDHEDLIGVLEVLDPAERDVMAPFVQRLGSELSRLGITEDVDLGDVPGFDLEIEDLDLSSQELTPGVVEITITDGVLRGRTEPESVPIGDVLRDLIEANGGEVDIQPSQDETRLGGRGTFLVVTQTGGRWHVSLFFTIAEYARRDARLPLPEPGSGVAPDSAESPEDAVRRFADAATALDLERMIALLPPDEMRALQAYAPLFLEDAQDSLDEFRVEEGFDASVDGLEFETRDVDGGTRVVPTAGVLDVSTSEGDLSYSFADGCVEAGGELGDDLEDEFGEARVCPEDVADNAGSGDPQQEADLRELRALVSDFQPGVVVVERDGAYYVDPLRTFSDLGLQLLAGIQREDLEEGGILYRLFTGDLAASAFDGGTRDEDCDLWGDTETSADDC